MKTGTNHDRFPVFGRAFRRKRFSERRKRPEGGIFLDEFLKITIKDSGVLEKEFADTLYEMKKPIGRGLHTAAAVFAPALRQHIADDWYDAWGPPKKYLRRTDYPEYGPGLYAQVEEAVVNGETVLFEYLPSGEHSLTGENASGDDLIRIIQDDRGWEFPPTYDRQGRKIGPRPFWNNFVEEIRDGLAMDAFEYGFTSGGWSMIREGGEADMEWGRGESLL